MNRRFGLVYACAYTEAWERCERRTRVMNRLFHRVSLDGIAWLTIIAT